MEEDEQDLYEPDDEVPETDPRYDEYHRVRRRCLVKTRSTMPTSRLPDFLERLLDLHQAMTLGFLESLKIGHLCVLESKLGVYLDGLQDGPGRILRAWDPDGAFALSIEPTATDDHWLVFAHKA